MQESAYSIRRVSARARQTDQSDSRARLRNLLHQLNWRVPTLTDETILCVRRMRLPPPRRTTPPASVEFQPPAELQNSVSNSLTTCARDAAWPARGPVPANANAVLFADRAELLACLARDWCAGDASTCWWWPVLFPRDDFGAVVRRAWLSDARPVPAALARLEAAGLAPQFLTRFSPVDVAALWRNIVNAFHLEALDAAWGATGNARVNPAPQHPSGEAAPWSAWVTCPAWLGMDAARVLIAAILLERAPAASRSLSFAREVRAWTQARMTDDALDAPSNAMFPFVEDGPAKSDPSRSALAPTDLPSTLDQEAMPGAERVEPAGPPNPKRIVADATPNRGSIVAARSSPIESSTNRSRVDDRKSPPRRRKPSPGTHPPKSRKRSIPYEKEKPTRDISAAPTESIALPPVALPDCTSTEWGGSLYLVNIAIALGLYGDFAAPVRPGLALPLWDFLALVGGRMIGDEFAEDPLCRLFARLSGRAENELPGDQFEPPAGETLAIWLERICHAVEQRVMASLGLDDDCDLRALLLNHQARIKTNSERMDAHFSLAKHPIELRLAGLDRDPGWVPAGGRGIYFHYD